MEKILVTGGAGFIGSHIAEELVKNYKVTVVDNLFDGKLSNISYIRKKIKFVKGDIRNFRLMKKLTKVDYVLHQAALRSVPASVKNPQSFNDVNIRGHFNLLDAARINDVKAVVFASSSSVYGNCKKFPQKENFLPMPISPYAITKLTGEAYCRYFYEQYGLNTVSLRYFNVYGERQNPNSQYAAVIPIFIKRIARNKSPVIYGNGKQSRDFTYVKDIVDANLKAMRTKNLKGEVFNICEGKSITVNYIAKAIMKLLNKDLKIVYAEKRAGDVFKTLGSPAKAKRLLKFKCKYSFDEGLRRTVEWFEKKIK